jgi:methionine-rich copper-binding protein CopC
VSSRRILSTVLAAMLIAVGLTVGLAGAASAHDVLISSSPADNATVATAPASLTFTFDQPVQNFDPVVSLIGPDGKQYANGTPSISGNVLSGTVTAGPAGRYTAAYRIVSADGHPVTGEIHFTLTGGGGAATPGGSGSGNPGSPTASVTVGTGGRVTAAPPAAGSTTVAPASSDASSGLSVWLWIGLAVAAIVIAVAAVLLLRRPGRSDPADRDY